MRMQLTFEQRSSLPVSAGEVWSRATTPEGINDELFPWLRMTVPDTMRGKTIDQLPLDQRLGRSWLLAMCVFPDLQVVVLHEAHPPSRAPRKICLAMPWRPRRTGTTFILRGVLVPPASAAAPRRRGRSRPSAT
jgi:hypothetical protein